MKKKRKHKKQQGATHPISESERIKNLMQISNGKLKYDKTLRKLRIPSDMGKTSGVRINKKDMYVD